ncbi:MAG: helix-turn-helix transcriptional regulator [Defluviitaleaceae bacterium]|nr:helix-turn-helix transcriptional regulator [Defluviitaleaceae bacterium]
MLKYTKEQLVDMFFGMGGNTDIETNINIQEKLKEYKQLNGHDRQIEDILLLSTIFKLESKFDNFKESVKVVSPIIERATFQNDLDLTDIRIITVAVGHTYDFRQSCFISEKLLKNLEKYKNHPRNPRIQMSVHANTSTKLLRSKYYDYLINSHEYLRKEFLIHINTAIELCKKENFDDMIGINYIRKGLFLGEFDFVDKGLEFIKKTENTTIYDMAVNDINEYEKYIKFPITGEYLKSVISKNFKAYRKIRNIKLKDLSEATNIGVGYLATIESGVKVPSLYNLLRISEALGISINDLVSDTKDLAFINENTLELDEATNMMVKLSPVELKLVTDVMRNLLYIKSNG